VTLGIGGGRPDPCFIALGVPTGLPGGWFLIFSETSVALFGSLPICVSIRTASTALVLVWWRWTGIHAFADEGTRDLRAWLAAASLISHPPAVDEGSDFRRVDLAKSARGRSRARSSKSPAGRETSAVPRPF